MTKPAPSPNKTVREERQKPLDEVDEVAPGVLRIQLPISLPGLGHVNCYALEDSNGLTLVDPGLPGIRTWVHLKRQLASAGFPIGRVHTVVITHSHPDHFGQAVRFQRKNGARIITHKSFRTIFDPSAEHDDDDVVTVFEPNTTSDSGPSDSQFRSDASASVHPDHNHADDLGPFAPVTPWGGRPYELPMRRRARYWAMRRLAGKFMVVPRPTDRVDEAEVLEIGGNEWVSVHTPGHTRDHLCLWNPNDQVMISGDHVLPTITPHISGLGASVDPLADFFSSLDRMASFESSIVLPAHGLAFADLAERAHSIRDHHLERLDVLRQAGNELGWGTVEQYMKALFQPRSWGPMAESETYAHLEHLRVLGQAEVHINDEWLRYSIRD